MYKQGLAIRFLVGMAAGFENGKNGTNGAKNFKEKQDFFKKNDIIL